MKRSGLFSSLAALAGAVVAPLSAQSLPSGIIEREITVPGPVPLPGTLTLPVGRGPFPGVVLVHGSGAGDRDETLGDNKPFRDIAWGLAERGVAVLRYDKRAKVGPGWFLKAGFTVYDETIQDALSALLLLRQQPELHPGRTAVLGHSLGGMVAPRIALADPKLAGVIIMAGATRVEVPAQMERQYRYIASVSGPDSAAVMAQWEKLAPIMERLRHLTPADSLDTKALPGLGGTSAKYWQDLAAHDPAVMMRDVHIPALVLQGMRDYQVPPDQLDDWLKVLGPHRDLTVKRYPALTHLMIAGSGPPGPAEYAVPGHVDTQVVADIASFVRGLKPR
jgi:dienelactone hydrolase